MSVTTLFILMMVFGIAAMIAAIREHWVEFSLFLIITVFSTLGFAFRLLG
jgi:membrane-associated phospholipid phosphatase